MLNSKKLKLDVGPHNPWDQFTVIQCEKCGVWFEPAGKEHKCKQKDIKDFEKEKNYASRLYKHNI